MYVSFNLRLNNRRNHIKRGFSGCEFTEHFLHSSRTHNFNIDTKITIIEEIKRHEMHIEWKKKTGTPMATPILEQPVPHKTRGPPTGTRGRVSPMLTTGTQPTTRR